MLKEKKKKEEELELLEVEEETTSEDKETSEDPKETEKEDKGSKDKKPKDKEEVSEELDFGIEAKEEEEEKEDSDEEGEEPTNKAELIKDSTLKPDFKVVAELFLAMDEAKTEEDLVALQGEYETYLKETLVPKIKKALGMKESGDTKKAGVKSKASEQPKERVTTPLRNRK